MRPDCGGLRVHANTHAAMASNVCTAERPVPCCTGMGRIARIRAWRCARRDGTEPSCGSSAHRLSCPLPVTTPAHPSDLMRFVLLLLTLLSASALRAQSTAVVLRPDRVFD